MIGEFQLLARVAGIVIRSGTGSPWPVAAPGSGRRAAFRLAARLTAKQDALGSLVAFQLGLGGVDLRRQSSRNAFVSPSSLISERPARLFAPEQRVQVCCDLNFVGDGSCD
jgi:hypothetical protein